MATNLFNKKSVVFKIIFGYALIALVAIATTSVGLLLIEKSRKYDTRISDNYYPVLMSVKDLSGLIKESNKLINNWIYQPDEAGKVRLKLLHVEELNAVIAQWNKGNGSLFCDETLLENTKALFAEQKKITALLIHEDDYADDDKVDKALMLLEGSVSSTYNDLLAQIETETNKLNGLLKEADETKAQYAVYQVRMFVFSIIITAIISLIAAYIANKNISIPIGRLKSYMLDLSKGRFPNIREVNKQDEIAEMEKAVSVMVDGLKLKADFAENIGKGNYDFEFSLISNEDTMGISLLKMRDNLRENAIEDEKRNRANIGLAKMGDILRASYTDDQHLYDKIISFCVNYMNANQGGLFLKNEDEKSMYLAACYAYNRKKFIEVSLEEGEGLVGQAYLEKAPVFLTEIPQNYFNITSGLGEAQPGCAIIVPLIHNDEVLGVLELASFHVMQEHERDLVIRLTETIASTVSSMRVNSKTKKLLQESQMLTEQMRSQEEEIRQNMEEIMATQEETNRKMSDYEEKLREKEAYIAQMESPAHK